MHGVPDADLLAAPRRPGVRLWGRTRELHSNKLPSGLFGSVKLEKLCPGAPQEENALWLAWCPVSDLLP